MMIFENPPGEASGIVIERKKRDIEREDFFYDHSVELAPRDEVIFGVNCVYRKH